MASSHRASRTFAFLRLAFLLLAVPATAHAADALFGARPVGSQVVPATGSTGSAEARVLLRDAGVLLMGRFSGLGSACTATHVHQGAPGANGPVILTAQACAGGTSGTIFATYLPTPGDVANLRNGLWYVDIHTTGFPDGEVRAQVLPVAAHIANLTGEQVVPAPTGVMATGVALATLNAAGNGLDYDVGWTNLTGGTTSIYLHGDALPGTNAPSITRLVGHHTGTNGGVHGSSALTPAQVAAFTAGKLYVNVLTATFPDGALRGQLKPPDKPFDFDADGAAEVAVFRPGTGIWYIVNQRTGILRTPAWGAASDRPTAADYDGDGKTDLAIWRSGVFWINPSATGGVLVQPWGTAATDYPVAPGDFDGDGRTDPAIYRRGASTGPSFFYILQSVNNAPRILNWGLGGDVDISADYDGDRKTDVSIYRVSTNTYYILGSTDGLIARTWGIFETDFLAPGDYDGDGKIDIAVFRFGGPGAGTWYVLKSSTQTLEATAFGALGDFPVPGDYDGDGRTDKAVVRSAGGGWTWYILRSSTGTMDVRPFGFTSDFPIPTAIIR